VIFHGFLYVYIPTSRSVLKDANSITATIQEMWQGQLCERSYGGSRGKALEVTVLGGVLSNVRVVVFHVVQNVQSKKAAGCLV
jgi:hypothetical protein